MMTWVLVPGLELVNSLLVTLGGYLMGLFKNNENRSNLFNLAVELSLFCYTKVLIHYKNIDPVLLNQNKCFNIRWTNFSPNELSRITCK